jgi:hypothetical protein
MTEGQRLEKLWLLHPNTFRLDAGMGYVGGREYKAKTDGIIKVKAGDLVVVNPGKISYGIEGAGDRIGWTEKVITPEMVGEKVAVFTSIEDKSRTDSIGIEQLIFMLNVIRSGGIAKVYRDLEELTTEQALRLPRRKDKKGREKALEKLINGD